GVSLLCGSLGLAGCGLAGSSSSPQVTVGTIPVPAHPAKDPSAPLYGIPRESFDGNDGAFPPTTTTTTTPPPPVSQEFGGDALFDTGQSILKKKARRALLKVLTNMLLQVAGGASARISIIGYTDTQGDAASNRDLSEKRARAVQTFFEEQGVSADGFGTVLGHGEDEAFRLVDDRDAQGNLIPAKAKQNRRVVISVVTSH
ncbi:MAG: OmpA family protein, partial [Actinomycetes bacterium]